MAAEHLDQLARQWIAEQGEEAGAHLADAIRELRAVGDRRGARLLAQIASAIDHMEGDIPRHARRTMSRRVRNDPSM